MIPPTLCSPSSRRRTTIRSWSGLRFMSVTRLHCGALPQSPLFELDDPRGIRGDGRQPRGIPVLPAPDALPVPAGRERTLGQRRRHVTHRTRRKSQDVLFIIKQRSCRVRLERVISYQWMGPHETGK